MMSTASHAPVSQVTLVTGASTKWTIVLMLPVKMEALAPAVLSYRLPYVHVALAFQALHSVKLRMMNVALDPVTLVALWNALI